MSLGALKSILTLADILLAVICLASKSVVKVYADLPVSPLGPGVCTVTTVVSY